MTARSSRPSFLRVPGRAHGSTAGRLRAVEHAYRTAIEREAAIGPPEPAKLLRSPTYEADREIELE
jgi:hypothetical protein